MPTIVFDKNGKPIREIAPTSPMAGGEPTYDELKAFVGPNVDYYFGTFAAQMAGERGKFNWAAFFFAGLWLLRRKMYRAGAVFFVALIVFRIIMGNLLPDMLIAIAAGLICGLYGNRWYYHQARRVIMGARSAGPIDESRLGELAKRGGTSFVVPVLVILLQFSMIVISSIANPRFERARMAAYQASAVNSLRTITTAEITYASSFNAGYSPTLAALGPATGRPTATNADLIDRDLASGRKSEYVFEYSPADANGDGYLDTYTVNADPVAPGKPGLRHFFTDATGVIRVEAGGPANVSSPIVR